MLLNPRNSLISSESDMSLFVDDKLRVMVTPAVPLQNLITENDKEWRILNFGCNVFWILAETRIQKTSRTRIFEFRIQKWIRSFRNSEDSLGFRSLLNPITPKIQKTFWDSESLKLQRSSKPPNIQDSEELRDSEYVQNPYRNPPGFWILEALEVFWISELWKFRIQKTLRDSESFQNSEFLGLRRPSSYR